MEIQCLEAEVKKKIAAQEAASLKRHLEQEAEEVNRRIKREEEDAEMKAKLEEEHTAIQRTLEESRRRIQYLEAMKELSAAQSRMKVYNQEPKDILGHGLVADNQLRGTTRHLPLPVFPSPQAITTSTSESTTELVKVLADALKGTYYENSTFLVLLHVNLGIWHVYRPKNSGKKQLPRFVMVLVRQKRHA